MSKLPSPRGLAALVTGASSGIGRALALRLARDGARVALVARREAALEGLAGEIRSAGGEALVVPCDVTRREAALAACRRVGEVWGGVDLLVNNAGTGQHRAFLDADLEDAEQMMRVNYFGALAFTKGLLPGMVERGRGGLVFVASVAGRIAPPGESAYAATKFALTGFANALSLEVEEAGVHVLCVYPGVVRTPFFDAEALAAMPPVARRSMLEPETVADAIVTALARGRRELTIPRRFAAAYPFQALAPGLTRRLVGRATRHRRRR